MTVSLLFGLGFALTICLWLLARLHAMWGYGGVWPAKTEADLARMVVGAKGITRMPPRSACFAVAVALVAVGFWPLWRIGMIVSPFSDRVSLFAGAAIAGVFALRGIAAYTSVFRRLAPEEPFATYDRHYYGPLCLALAAGFMTLIFGGTS
jgi:Zn-dependent protease with chaperone function